MGVGAYARRVIQSKRPQIYKRLYKLDAGPFSRPLAEHPYSSGRDILSRNRLTYYIFVSTENLLRSRHKAPGGPCCFFRGASAGSLTLHLSPPVVSRTSSSRLLTECVSYRVWAKSESFFSGRSSEYADPVHDSCQLIADGLALAVFVTQPVEAVRFSFVRCWKPLSQVCPSPVGSTRRGL